MLKKILTGVLVAAALGAAAVATIGSAEARYGRDNALVASAGLGLLGGVVAGAAYNNAYDDGYEAAPVYYYHSCHIERRRVHNYYGWHWIRVRVCD